MGIHSWFSLLYGLNMLLAGLFRRFEFSQVLVQSCVLNGVSFSLLLLFVSIPSSLSCVIKILFLFQFIVGLVCNLSDVRTEFCVFFVIVACHKIYVGTCMTIKDAFITSLYVVLLINVKGKLLAISLC